MARARRSNRPGPASPRYPRCLRKLRAANHPAALACANLVFHTRDAAALAKSVFGRLAVRCVTVTGDAGYGKTQLAAKLASPAESRPAGMLLFGRQLRSRDGLDDLAARVSVNGRRVETFEALLAAVDAAAARAQCRLPIVIDGLNEAEDPRDWKPLLAASGRCCSRTTRRSSSSAPLRSAFVSRAIPTVAERLRGSRRVRRGRRPRGRDVLRPLQHRRRWRRPAPRAIRSPDHVADLLRGHEPDQGARVRLVGRAPSLNAMFDGYLD